MSKRTTSSTTTQSTGPTKIPTDPSEIQTQLQSSFRTLLDNYASIPPRLKLIDSFLLFFILSGVLQFAYRLLITAYPYNAFIGGFGSTVGQFCLLAGLRAQISPGREGEFKSVSQERAFADFCLSSVILHVFAFNFLG